MARSCKTHEFGDPVAVGGGIVRRACSRCGAVQLDITRQEVLANSGLFQSGRIKWMTWEPAQETRGRLERRFGKAPEERRSAATAIA
ncbi:MAG: hypothetical protein GWP04_02275 [Gammaproteobacteria bacterium]|nr:hypothetical protein [Gammaproteobacteria bacterium]